MAHIKQTQTKEYNCNNTNGNDNKLASVVYRVTGNNSF
jgi:hypothetical protein